MVSRGENNPSPGVGGTSTNCIPAMSENDWWIGLLVMVSARGDMSAASSGKLGRTAMGRFGVGSTLGMGFDGGARLSEGNPKPAGFEPNL